MLSVTANNSSLNQILREISRLTGMKITGGVNDERVFATYGPASPAAVVTALLDGTGSNFLLVHSAANPDGGTAPVELVLTPRHGGPTPPNPNAASSNEAADSENLAPPTPGNYVPPPIAAPAAPPAAVPAQNSVAPTSPPEGSTPAAPSTTPDATTPDNPNGVKSPQQIYEQLLRLRQQPQQTPPN